MVEATEHHEIVLEVEGELRGLRKALNIMRYGASEGCKCMECAEDRGPEWELLCDEIRRVQQVLAEITEEE